MKPPARRARARGQARSVADAARCEHGQETDRFGYRGQELPDRRRPAHVPARLETLGDHGVDACIGRRLRFLDGADLDEDLDPAPMRVLDERSRITPEKDDGGHPLCDRDLKLLPNRRPVLFRCIRVFEVGEDEVDPERPVGQLPGLLDRPLDLLREKTYAPEHPEAARVRHGRDKRWAGARTEPDREHRILDPESSAKRRIERDHGLDRAAFVRKGQHSTQERRTRGSNRSDRASSRRKIL